ncbi:hypothetical protein [Rubrivivax albus]|uniref:Polysaccharide deacetylase n=1 Tax=Rubrivivax albus TaxID=2499835 RepID=A0A3S2URS1_9BURK|nr:hypothetical protein [Rubrivivax albus]RVT53510.1 hypothetical protein ENE75_00995 [Rubrivivax albus]
MADALIQALDRAAGPHGLFIRCDDGGWDAPALFALIDVTAAHGVPVDVAMIPAATEAPLAQALAARHDAAPALLGLHVHGWSHTNHEPEGRRCEFGPARPDAVLRGELAAARQRLHALLGDRLDPIFTPPWNRCTDRLPPLLAQAGWLALSRESRAPAQAALPELPVHVDWSRVWRDAVAAGADPAPCLADAMARAVDTHEGPVGLMLHHAAMDARQRRLLSALLARWAGHPKARWARMRHWLEAMQPCAA